MKQIQLSLNTTENNEDRVDFTLTKADSGSVSASFYNSPNKEANSWKEIHIRTKEKILDEVNNNRLQSKLGW